MRNALPNKRLRPPRDENMVTGCCRTLPCEFMQSSTVVANTGRPIGFRHGAALAGLLTWCVVMMVPFATLRAQTPFYFAGISPSWGGGIHYPLHADLWEGARDNSSCSSVSD